MALDPIVYTDNSSRASYSSTAAIRSWLLNHGREVIEIAATDLHDQAAMAHHFRRLANYLGARKLRQRIRECQDWFLPSDALTPSV